MKLQCDYHIVFVFVWILLVAAVEGCGRGSIYLDNNGYRQILIAIDSSIPENEGLLQRIRAVFTDASAFLYSVTKKRAYFADITVLIPQTWQDKPEYQAATKESIDKSDILIDEPDVRYNQGDRPFVIKTTPCGELGHYMHLTPAYLTDPVLASQWGPYEKTLIHEWAHLRYGVYDEYVSGDSPDQFYAADNGEIEGTRCSSTLTGMPEDSASPTGFCTFTDGLPDPGCKYVDDREIDGDYGSLMYRQYLSHVVSFCDNDEASPNTLHNRQAPNKQNQLCYGQSIWEVLRQHGDFYNNTNPPRDVTSTVPTFTFVKAGHKRAVLVLDISGSMEENDKIGKLGQAAHNYIMNIARDGQELGIVVFNGNAAIMKPMMTINDQTRTELALAIPTTANGATSIGAGLRSGLSVLGGANGDGAMGGVIILVSDGIETNPPFVGEVRPEVETAGVIIDTIAITAKADNNLEILAAATDGMSFFYSVSETSNALNDAFVAVGDRGISIREKSIQLASQSHMLAKGETIDEAINFDSTIGENTEFVIAYENKAVTVIVTTPSGLTLTSNSREYTLDTQFHIIRIQISGKAEAGRWRYQVTNPHATQTVQITVTTRTAADSPSPIIAQAMWGKKMVRYPDDHQILYVSVSKGYSPILRATVTATLERPNVGRSASLPSEILLYDKGSGADIYKNDGIYSGYVSSFSKNGRYNVKIKVNNSPATVVSNNGMIGGSAMAADVKDGSTEGTEVAEDFQRITSAGSFELVDYVPGEDRLAPSRISDFQATKVTYGGDITLVWTAPGDDLDNGQVHHYNLWVAEKFDEIFDDHRQTTQLSDIQTLAGLNNASASGEQETFVINVENSGAVTYYFVVAAVDAAGNTSPKSNIVSVSMLFLQPDVHVVFIVSFIFVLIAMFVGLAIAGYFILRPKPQETSAAGKASTADKTEPKSSGFRGMFGKKSEPPKEKEETKPPKERNWRNIFNIV